MNKVLHCYAEGHDGEWEAICVDLDIAVQGTSFDEVYHSLIEAIQLYLETVSELPEEERKHLLNRPAPLGLRVKFALRSFIEFIKSGRGNGEYMHQFTLPCAA